MPQNHPALALLVFASALASSARAQDAQPGANFTSKPSAVPQTTSNSEAARLGDFDLDGDLDAVVTQGGLLVKSQSRFWRSNASTAGTGFVFSDLTASNFPILTASTLGATAFDIDTDGDLDLLFANTTQTFQQSNSWLVNQGGAQGGSSGVFVLDLARYNGLGLAGSSVAPSLVLAGGGFADWSANCDFADVDLDGDFDMFQSSIGPNTNGTTMHRLFLNSGQGQFAEYNPSGSVSGATSLTDGNAAGYVEGSQANATADTTGANHDLTGIGWDSGFADIDNDYDLDLAVLDRAGQTRMYQNRFAENGLFLGNEGSGTRLYRDVTAAAFATAQTGGVAMDIEFADLDNDDDLDVWGVSYSNFSDRILTNDGTGTFTSAGSPLGDPSADDNEVDMLDYDGDGDVDVFASNFQGVNSLYKNTLAQGGSTATAAGYLQRTGVLGLETELASPGTVADSWLSAGAGDLDNDRDTDLLVTQDGTSTSAGVFVNSLGIPDVIAPRIPRIDVLGTLTPAGSTPRVVAAQVLDNDGLDRFGDATAVLKFTVDGGPVKTSAARWSGGNVFRSTIPGYWFGNIQYWLEVTDRNTNTGSSLTKGISVPRAGISIFGTGLAGCAGNQSISVNSVVTPGNNDFQVKTTNCPPNTMNLLLESPVANPSGSDIFSISVPSYVGLDIGLAAFDQPSDASGLGVAAIPVPANPFLVGLSFTFQTVSYWGSGPCSPSIFNLSSSNGLTVTVQP